MTTTEAKEHIGDRVKGLLAPSIEIKGELVRVEDNEGEDQIPATGIIEKNGRTFASPIGCVSLLDED